MFTAEINTYELVIEHPETTAFMSFYFDNESTLLAVQRDMSDRGMFAYTVHHRGLQFNSCNKPDATIAKIMHYVTLEGSHD